MIKRFVKNEVTDMDRKYYLINSFGKAVEYEHEPRIKILTMQDINKAYKVIKPVVPDLDDYTLCMSTRGSNMLFYKEIEHDGKADIVGFQFTFSIVDKEEPIDISLFIQNKSKFTEFLQKYRLPADVEDEMKTTKNVKLFNITGKTYKEDNFAEYVREHEEQLGELQDAYQMELKDPLANNKSLYLMATGENCNVAKKSALLWAMYNAIKPKLSEAGYEKILYGFDKCAYITFLKEDKEYRINIFKDRQDNPLLDFNGFLYASKGEDLEEVCNKETDNFLKDFIQMDKEGCVIGNVKQLGENICGYCSTKDLSYLTKPAVTEKPIGQTYKVKQQEQLKVG